MAVDDPMSVDERRKSLRQMQERYRKACRQGRKQLLDEMEAVSHLHRKSLIRLMNGDLGRQPRCRQRGRTYGIEVVRALQVLAESFDYLCAVIIGGRSPQIIGLGSPLNIGIDVPSWGVPLGGAHAAEGGLRCDQGFEEA